MPTHDGAWEQGTPCWVDCQVDDPAKARDYYSALFGWEIDDTPAEAGGYLMATIGGKAAAGIGPKPEGMSMPSVWTTYLAADSADDIAAKVGSAGGTVVMPPFDVMNVGRMFVASDPAGAMFGVWEPKAHTGAGVYNQHGAYCWNENHSQDYAAAQKFYTDVFGYQFQEIGDGENMIYSVFSLPGAPGGMADSKGGFADDSKQPGPGMSYWLTWFQVDDCDASTAKATELGSQVLMPPATSPFGRMAIVTAPQGETFGLIDTSTTTQG